MAFLYAMPLAVLAVLLIRDLNPSGVRSYRYSIDQQSAAVSQLFPAQRLFKIADGAQQLRQQPVYVTVRYPHRYDRAIVTIRTVNPAGLRWYIGLEVAGTDEWSYDLYTPDEAGTVALDLANAKVTDRSVRFIIALPDDSAPEYFAIDDIQVRLARKPLFI